MGGSSDSAYVPICAGEYGRSISAVHERVSGRSESLIPGDMYPARENTPTQHSQVRPVTMVEGERQRIAHQLLGKMWRLEQELKASKARLNVAVGAAGTTVCDIFGRPGANADRPYGDDGTARSTSADLPPRAVRRYLPESPRQEALRHGPIGAVTATLAMRRTTGIGRLAQRKLGRLAELWRFTHSMERGTATTLRRESAPTSGGSSRRTVARRAPDIDHRQRQKPWRPTIHPVHRSSSRHTPSRLNSPIVSPG